MHRSIARLSALFLTAFASPALASEDAQAWQTLTLNVALPSDFKLSSETVFRTSDARGFYEVEENLMAGYKVNKHVTVWLGYTHDPQYSHGKFTVLERRFRQQVNFDNIMKVGPVNISGRLRLEERWREGQAGTGWRFRPYVKGSLPLGGKTALNVSHESFLNLNTTGFQRVTGEDRMRNAISISTPIAKKLTLDFGYLNQHGFVRGGPDSSDHVATIGLSASL